MDLSQQELPLTTYFTRGNKNSRTRATSRKKGKLTQEDAQPVARHSKRKRIDVASSESSSNSSVHPSALRQTALQLPTPAASARKRTRGGHLEELPSKVQSASADPRLSPAECDIIPSSEKVLAQLDFGPTPSKPPRSCPTEGISLVTPSTSRRKTNKPTERERPVPLPLNHTETVIITPHSSPRPISEPLHHIDCLPLTHANLPLPSEQNAVGVSENSAPSKSLGGQSSDCVIPMYPVSSSQSQYLLDLDATPRKPRPQRYEHVSSSQSQYLLRLDATPRKPRPQRYEHVHSSQTLEGRELTSSLNPVAMTGLSVEQSHGKNTSVRNAQTPRLSRGRMNQHVHALGYSPVGTSVSTPPSSSRFFEKKKALDDPSSDPSSPSRRKVLPPPGHQTRTPRKSTSLNPTENISPARVGGSATEPDSDLDVAQVLFRDNHSPMYPHGNVPTVEDDSATEAESDTEILHCVAEIGKNRLRERRSKLSREDAVVPLVISPLVSPARSRIAPRLPATGSSQISVREGTDLDVSGSHMERLSTPSESLPSVVRNFMDMFSGDESYPADFPESLRI